MLFHSAGVHTSIPPYLHTPVPLVSLTNGARGLSSRDRSLAVVTFITRKTGNGDDERTTLRETMNVAQPQPNNVRRINPSNNGNGTGVVAGSANDPWSMSSSSYDPSNFYTRATDGNGHDGGLQVKVSPALLGQINHILESRIIPQYRTRADIVRDALIHRLRYLADEYDGSVNLADLEIEQRQAEIDKFKAQRIAWRTYLDDLDNQLKDLIERGEYEEADYLIDMNEWNESMSVPYLKELTKLLGKHRKAMRS